MFVRTKFLVLVDHGARGRNSAEASVINRLGILEREDVSRIVDTTPGGSVGVLTTAGQTLYLTQIAAKALGVTH